MVPTYCGPGMFLAYRSVRYTRLCASFRSKCTMQTEGPLSGAPTTKEASRPAKRYSTHSATAKRKQLEVDQLPSPASLAPAASAAVAAATAAAPAKRAVKKVRRSTAAADRALIVPQQAHGAAHSNVIFHYGPLVPGQLVRRYKRFLADIIFSSSSSSSSTVAASATTQTTPLPGQVAAGPDSKHQDQAAVASADGGTGDADVVVHCPNTGPMTGLLDHPLAAVWCSTSDAKGRKYAHTLEMIRAGGPGSPWVGVHSAQANKLALRLLMQRQLPQLGEYISVQQEVRYGAGGESRVDFVLTRHGGALVYVEVKSVTLAEQYVAGGQGQYSGAVVPPAKTKRGAGGKGKGAGKEKGAADVQDSSGAASLGGAGAGAAVASTAQEAAMVAPAAAAQPAGGSMIALFPDTVSERAQRHVRELMGVVASGHAAVCLFLVQRADCTRFAPCHAKDPEYGVLLLQAAAAGVQMLAVGCELQPAASGGVVKLLGPLDVELDYGHR